MKKLLVVLIFVASFALAQAPTTSQWKRTGHTTIAPRRAGDSVAIDTTLRAGQVVAPGLPTIALRGWDAAIGKFQQTGTGQATIAWIGDSWAANETVCLPVRTALQTKYGNAGAGYVPFDGYSTAPSGVTLARVGTWVDTGQYAGMHGLGDMETNSTDTSTPAKYTVTATMTDAVIHYLAQTNGGTFTYQVDSGATVTVPTTITGLNLLSQSQTFSNAAWTKSATSITTTNNLAPDGTSTASFVKEDGSSGLHYISQSPTLAANTPYADSLYVKAGTRAFITYTSASGGAYGDCNFDLTLGIVETGCIADPVKSAAIVSCATANVCGPSFPAAPGWWRVSVTLLNVSAGSTQAYWKLSSSAYGSSYQGDNASGLYVWGAQMNRGYATMPYVFTPTGPTGPIYTTLLVSELSNASHALKITITVAGTAGVTLLGAESNISVPGVRLHRIPSSGANISTYLAADATAWKAGMLALNPSLVVISLGVNELLGNMAPATQVAGYATLAGQIHAVLPNAEILLVPPADVGATGTYTMTQYAAAQRDAALANGWGFVDTTALFGPYTASSARGLWTNTTHVNAYGGQVIANHVLTVFRRGL